jgi:hypothetical protein
MRNDSLQRYSQPVLSFMDFPLSPRRTHTFASWNSISTCHNEVGTDIVLSSRIQLSKRTFRDVEKLCGASRTAFIFFSSGVMGNLTSALFTPYRQECGPSGAIFGILGTLISEILKAWPLLKSPWRALGQLSWIVVLFFLIGLLPWVDNYAHIAGFFTGLSLSYALLPGIEIEEGETRTLDKFLVPALIISFLLSFVTMLAIFYVVDTSGCEICKLFSCIPFTKDFCSEMYINYQEKRRLF